jgi:hypothetical protein
VNFRGVLEAADGRATYPRIEASKFKTPTLDGDEGAELSIGFGGVWLRRAGRFKLGRALALAMAARPSEVDSAVSAMADLVHLLDDELSQIMTRSVVHRIWLNRWAHVRGD